MTAKTGVSASVSGPIGASKAAAPYKEGDINIRFSGGAGAGCLKG